MVRGLDFIFNIIFHMLQSKKMETAENNRAFSSFSCTQRVNFIHCNYQSEGRHAALPLDMLLYKSRIWLQLS